MRRSLGLLCIAAALAASRAGAVESRVQLEIEYPPDGAVVGRSACGLFVAGRAVAHERLLRRFDLAIVIDTSGSTLGPSGADIDGDGSVGEVVRVPLGFGRGESRSSDPADSILAAEVAAARRLLTLVDRRLTRVTVVTFSGRTPGSPIGQIHGRAARTREPLTPDYDRIERALDRILAEDPAGGTNMAAGSSRPPWSFSGWTGRARHPTPRA